jgi:Ni,Fe-hydrogenase III large subunit
LYKSKIKSGEKIVKLQPSKYFAVRLIKKRVLLLTMMRDENAPLPMRNCGSHPLIHSFALATMVLHVGMEQNRQECRLKYVMCSFDSITNILY